MTTAKRNDVDRHIIKIKDVSVNTDENSITKISISKHGHSQLCYVNQQYFWFCGYAEWSFENFPLLVSSIQRTFGEITTKLFEKR